MKRATKILIASLSLCFIMTASACKNNTKKESTKPNNNTEISAPEGIGEFDESWLD